MEFIPYKKEADYNFKLKTAKNDNIKLKLSHAALFGKNASF